MAGIESSPRALADHKASLSVSIAPTHNGRHLVHHISPDEPYFHLGDTAWELLHRLSFKEAEMFLRNRASKGFTGIMIVLMAEHGGLDYPNRDGEWPFHPLVEEDQQNKHYMPDLLRPNPAYFAFLDKLIPVAAKLGITLWLTPTWGRYINGGYYGSPILFDEKTAFAFGSYLGERYPFHPFILGGDSNRYWNPDTWKHVKSGGEPGKIPVQDFGPVYEAMARGILEGEIKAKEQLRKDLAEAEGYNTFITFHSAQVWLPSTPQTSASAQFPNADWLSLDVIQTGHHDSYAAKLEQVENIPMWFARSSYIPVRKMYDTPGKDGRPRPVMDLEPHYENTHERFVLKEPIWIARDIRAGGWQAIFAGACGYTYGCNSIWQMHNSSAPIHVPIAQPTTAYTDWYLELDLDGAFQASLMRSIMVSLPNYFDRVPDQSFIVSSTNEPTDGSRAGDKLISGMRSKGWAAVHLPYGGQVEIDLEKAKISTKWRAWWINPKTGGREVFKRGEGGGQLKVEAPSGGTLDDDWLLLVEDDVGP